MLNRYSKFLVLAIIRAAQLWRRFVARINAVWQIGSAPLRGIVAATTIVMLLAVLVTIENGLVFSSNEPLYLLLLAAATLAQTCLFCLSFACRDDTAVRVVNVGTFGLAAEVTMLWLSSSEKNSHYQSMIARGAIIVGLIIMYTVIMITARSGRETAGLAGAQE